MKVYIVFCTGGHNEIQVEHVFATERKALDYVIQRHYSEECYKKMMPAWLDDNARPHIEEHDVE